VDQLRRLESEQPRSRLSIDSRQIDGRSSDLRSLRNLDSRDIAFATDGDAKGSHLGRTRALSPQDLDLDGKTLSHRRRDVITARGHLDGHTRSRIACGREKRQDQNAKKTSREK